MGQIKCVISDVQKNPKLFNPIVSDIEKFGCQAVADAGGLACYQSVSNWKNRKPVRVSTEKKILEGVEKLNLGFVPSVAIVNNIINIHAQQDANNQIAS